MSAINNPALQAFVSQIRDELLVAQVLIERADSGYRLHHIEDRDRGAFSLRALRLSDLRALVQNTKEGAFRPLKSAPTLPNGWRLKLRDDAELEVALNHLYPGAIADWFAAQSPVAPVTHFRAFANRQTGMYRIAKLLSDEQVCTVARACCHRNFCLKRRLWSVKGIGPESAGEKSLIPCLEPCAVLLEFARNTMRIEQEGRHTVELQASEFATLNAALEAASSRRSEFGREADFAEPGNPRRARLLLEKLKPVSALVKPLPEE